MQDKQKSPLNRPLIWTIVAFVALAVVPSFIARVANDAGGEKQVAAAESPPVPSTTAAAASADPMAPVEEVAKGLASSSTPEPEASPPLDGYESGVSSEGHQQYWRDGLSLEQCVAAKATALAKLNVSPRRIIEIVNTSQITMTRVCLDDGKSLIVTCSGPDRRLLMTLSPQTTEVGCPP